MYSSESSLFVGNTVVGVYVTMGDILIKTLVVKISIQTILKARVVSPDDFFPV